MNRLGIWRTKGEQPDYDPPLVGRDDRGTARTVKGLTGFAMNGHFLTRAYGSHADTFCGATTHGPFKPGKVTCGRCWANVAKWQQKVEA